MRTQGCTWLSSLFCSSVKRGWCFCMLLRASRSSRSTVSMSLFKNNGGDQLESRASVCSIPTPGAFYPAAVPDGQLIRHHDLVVRVGHQQPDGVLQDTLDELLLATVSTRGTAAPCWLFA